MTARCRAAAEYAALELRQPRRVACAVVAVPITHENGGSLRKDVLYNTYGHAILEYVKQTWPGW